MKTAAFSLSPAARQRWVIAGLLLFFLLVSVQ
jgi:hypothetical protein